ncbi:MAG: lipocalin family protein [Bacteroidales bacterium]|nr:lipocalin family protein [Bacteroidales bacterium]
MKRTRHILLLTFLSAMTLMLSGCLEKPEPVDISLLPGKWVRGTEYYRYDRNGDGATWDTSDDVDESEAQPFTWEYNETNNTLTLVHQMEMGGVVPKSYTVTSLTEDELEYKDRFGVHYTFKRV